MSYVEPKMSNKILSYLLKIPGLIRCVDEGTLYKPASVKPILGKREINFYETVQSSTEKDLVQLEKLIPDYKGHTELCINGEMV